MIDNSRQRTTNVPMGRWRITEMDLCEPDSAILAAFLVKRVRGLTDDGAPRGL